MGRTPYHVSRLFVRCRAVAIPGGEATGQDGLDGAAVLLCEIKQLIREITIDQPEPVYHKNAPLHHGTHTDYTQGVLQ